MGSEEGKPFDVTNIAVVPDKTTGDGPSFVRFSDPVLEDNRLVETRRALSREEQISNKQESCSGSKPSRSSENLITKKIEEEQVTSAAQTAAKALTATDCKANIRLSEKIWKVVLEPHVKTQQKSAKSLRSIPIVATDIETGKRYNFEVTFTPDGSGWRRTLKCWHQYCQEKGFQNGDIIRFSWRGDGTLGMERGKSVDIEPDFGNFGQGTDAKRALTSEEQSSNKQGACSVSRACGNGEQPSEAKSAEQNPDNSPMLKTVLITFIDLI